MQAKQVGCFKEPKMADAHQFMLSTAWLQTIRHEEIETNSARYEKRRTEGGNEGKEFRFVVADLLQESCISILNTGSSVLASLD